KAYKKRRSKLDSQYGGNQPEGNRTAFFIAVQGLAPVPPPFDNPARVASGSPARRRATPHPAFCAGLIRAPQLRSNGVPSCSRRGARAALAWKKCGGGCE